MNNEKEILETYILNMDNYINECKLGIERNIRQIEISQSMVKLETEQMNLYKENKQIAQSRLEKLSSTSIENKCPNCENGTLTPASFERSDRCGYYES